MLPAARKSRILSHGRNLLPKLTTSGEALSVGVLTLLLWTPSIFLFFKYGGALGLALSPLYTLSCVLVWRKCTRNSRLAPRTVNRALIYAAFGAILLAVAIGHPLAKSGQFGPGSDSDEALELAVHAVLHGDYPYSARTHLGNPITPLPGWIALAIPFVLLGKAAYLNVFWFGLGLALLGRWSRHPGALAWLLLVSCPAILYEAVTGVDYIANSLVVMLSSLTLILVCRESLGRTLVAAFAFGVALTSRWNFLLIVPLVVSRVAQTAGTRRALASAALVVLFPAVSVTILVLLNGEAPIASSPLHVLTKLRLIGPSATLLGWLVLASATLLCLVLSHPSVNASTFGFLRSAAVVQATLVFGLVLTQWTSGSGARALLTTVFGAFYLCFGLGALHRVSPRRLDGGAED